MYTSVQSRASNPQPAGVNSRWALNLPFTVLKQVADDGDHTTTVVSMREHVMPLMKKFKEDMPTHVRNLLAARAWQVIVEHCVKTKGVTQPRYAASVALGDEIKLMAEGFKANGFTAVKVLGHRGGNIRQLDSLVALLEHHGLKVQVEWTGHDVFRSFSLIVGQAQLIHSPFELSYHLEGPKSVYDVEGNDTVFVADFKAKVNHSEAVGVVAWKNYNGFNPEL